MRILIAEDDPISRRLLQRHLEKWGHEVVAAINGQQAWEFFQEDNFSVVISDWMMPGIDGIELVRRIRAEDHSGYIYTILLTAKGQKEDLIIAMDAGADDFLTKPFDADELKARLRAGERILMLEHRLAERNRELEKANYRMRSSLEAAANIQKSLLPNTLPEIENVDLAWFFKPCDELAGDIFNMFKLDDDHFGLYILDVSGHGVPAALLSVTLSRLLIPNSGHTGLLVKEDPKKGKKFILSPAEVANCLNAQFPIDGETGQFFTLIYGILNIRSYDFCYISAGHPGILYLPKKSAPEIIEMPGLPIGFDEKTCYEEKHLSLKSGDRLVLYSDGIIEATGVKEEVFGRKRLLNAFVSRNGMLLSELLQACVDDVTNWTENEQLEDDVTMMALKVG